MTVRTLYHTHTHRHTDTHTHTHLRPLALVEPVGSGAASWLPEGGGGQGLPHDIPPTERGLLGYGE